MQEAAPLDRAIRSPRANFGSPIGVIFTFDHFRSRFFFSLLFLLYYSLVIFRCSTIFRRRSKGEVRVISRGRRKGNSTRSSSIVARLEIARRRWEDYVYRPRPSRTNLSVGKRRRRVATTTTTPGVPTSAIAVPPLIFRREELLPNGLNFRVLSPMCARIVFSLGTKFSLSQRALPPLFPPRRTTRSTRPALFLPRPSHASLASNAESGVAGRWKTGSERLELSWSARSYTVRKFVLNITHFTCPKRSTQIIMLIWHKMNMLESNTNFVKINTKNVTFWHNLWKHIFSVKLTFTIC